MSMLIAPYFYAVMASPITTSYRAEARNLKGELVYTETHEAKMNKNKEIQSVTTLYLSPEGEIIARLESDFSKSLTAPEHLFTDLRDQTKQGVRIIDDQFVMYRSKSDSPEQTKNISRNKFKEGLVVGCQGLHYYLQKNLDTLKTLDSIKVKLLIPGRLDHYSFLLSRDGETSEGYIQLRLRVENWFLRLFAPSFSMIYDPKSGNLLEYTGITHIKDSKGKLQKVKIQYIY